MLLGMPDPPIQTPCRPSIAEHQQRTYQPRLHHLLRGQGIPKFQAALARLDPRAISTLYQDQDNITGILGKRVAGKHTQYLVQWTDNIMLQEHVSTHLPHFATRGYHPQNTQDISPTHTRVSWKPTWENLDTLITHPNWLPLLQEWQDTSRPTPTAPTSTRVDSHLTPLQQQGCWETTPIPTLPQQIHTHTHIDCTASNPDLDIQPPGTYVLQQGLQHPTTGNVSQNDTTYVYNPTGRCIGSIPNAIVDYIIWQAPPTPLPEASLNIANMLLRTPLPPQGSQLKPHTLRMPDTFTSALPMIGINHERHNQPLTPSVGISTYSSPDSLDIPLGARDTTFAGPWYDASFLQSPPNQDLLIKAIRWAIASCSLPHQTLLYPVHLPQAKIPSLPAIPGQPHGA